MPYTTCMTIAWAVGLSATAAAAYVQPIMGGNGPAPMKHADISFDGTNLSVQIDGSVATPKLQPLNAPDQFDPQGTWGMIQGHAYNFQYGWNPAQFTAYPPLGAWVWIRQTDASPGLQAYQRSPASPAGEPIFGTHGSSLAWRWGGTMTHNLYAVLNPTESNWFATYQVYIGDDSSGEPVSGYQAAEVTFHFLADVPQPGDYNQDGELDSEDFTAWKTDYGQTGPSLRSDGHADGQITGSDYAVWREAMANTPGVPRLTTPTPEPSSLCGIIAAGALCLVSARKRLVADDEAFA